MENSDNKFSTAPFNSSLLIWKGPGYWWNLCLKNKMNEDGSPQVIGSIGTGMSGSLNNSTNLAWMINEEYRGQGLMSLFLEIYLNELTPDIDGFAVVISKENTPSLKLALKCGFQVYEEREEFLYLKK